MKKTLYIVVADGRVESVFLPEGCEDLDIQVCDFDTFDLTEQEELADFVDICREKGMKEVVC